MISTKTAHRQNTSPASTAKSRLMAVCLLNAGRSAEAEQYIKARVTQDGLVGSDLHFYLGVAYAMQERLDEAVNVLRELTEKHPQDHAVQQAALYLLHTQAIRKMSAEDWAGAGTALNHALSLAPAAPEIKSLLARVENVLPAAYLKANKRREAADVWEKIQREKPGSGRVAHSLALLYSYWAEALQQQGQPASEIDALWHKAISNRALVRFDDAFWSEWIEQRRAVYQISNEDAAKLRLAWSDELIKRFRRYAHEYEESDERDAAERYRQLEMKLWLEQTTACAIYELKKVLCQNCRRPTAAILGEGGLLYCELEGCHVPLEAYRAPHNVPAFGLIMLHRFGVEAAAHQLLGMAHELPNGGALSGDLSKIALPFVRNNADVLRFCLSPARAAFALVVHRRYEDAIAQLEGTL